MTHGKIEKEAKFYIRNLKNVERIIKDLGGELTQPRTFEVNLRFDTPNRDLSNAYKVLRLRHDTRVRLTFKGPADPTSAVSARPEYEVEISDLEAGRRILEALGYEVVTIYEKYRSSYLLDRCELSLDKMPFGDFIEIEGPDAGQIHAVANKLGLQWKKRASLSYLHLFALMKENIRLAMRDLTFDNFAELTIKPEDLQLEYAD
ncbi:MAG: class IV adenylate cyclase [Anaerolineaceae bacterium]|nr:class IV adenylate cyclase [Anaerolineaceae bacterium]